MRTLPIGVTTDKARRPVPIVAPRAPTGGYLLRPFAFSQQHPHWWDRDARVFSDVIRRSTAELSAVGLPRLIVPLDRSAASTYHDT